MGKAPNVEMTAVDKKYWDDSLELEFLRAGDGALVSTLNGKGASNVKYEGVYANRKQPPEVEGQPPEGQPPKAPSEVASTGHLSLDTLGGEAKPESFLR